MVRSADSSLVLPPLTFDSNLLNARKRERSHYARARALP